MPALFRGTCLYWVNVLEEMQSRATNKAGVSVWYLKTKDQTRLSGGTPAACPYSQAMFPCAQCHFSIQAQVGRELGAATMEALKR